MSERQADEKPSQAVEKPAPPVSAQIVKRTKDLLPNKIRMQKQLADTQDRLSRLESWCAAVGFDADTIRALRPGEYVARNLTTGGMDRGRVL